MQRISVWQLGHVFYDLCVAIMLNGINVPGLRALNRFCAVFIFSLSHILTSIRNYPVRIRTHDWFPSHFLSLQFGARCVGVLATSGHSISSSDSKVSDNVYRIIPSYSEALLMSSYTLNGKIIGKRCLFINFGPQPMPIRLSPQL